LKKFISDNFGIDIFIQSFDDLAITIDENKKAKKEEKGKKKKTKIEPEYEEKAQPVDKEGVDEINTDTDSEKYEKGKKSKNKKNPLDSMDFNVEFYSMNCLELGAVVNPDTGLFEFD
jgi:hypothetical protein